MSRPLMQHQIGLLEEMFAVSPTDTATLKKLTQELHHRTTPRAAALLARVEEALNSASKKEGAVTVASILGTKSTETPSLASLWETPSKTNPVAPNDAAPAKLVHARDAAKEKSASAPTQPKPTNKMPLAEAYKLLRSAPEASWTTIEQSRRRLVSDSSPLKTVSLSPDKRDQISEHARCVNIACQVIWDARQKEH